jgi:acyl dehydratase
MSLLTDEVRAWIGKEAVYEAPEEIGRAAIRYFALALGDDNPLYTDEEHARANGYPGVIAPPTMICETNQFVGGPRDANGYLTQMFELDIPNTRQIRGGNSYEFFRPVLPADRVTITWRLEDITERKTSAGIEMLVVTSVATYTDAGGELLARNTETIIYQEQR